MNNYIVLVYDDESRVLVEEEIRALSDASAYSKAVAIAGNCNGFHHLELIPQEKHEEAS